MASMASAVAYELNLLIWTNVYVLWWHSIANHIGPV